MKFSTVILRHTLSYEYFDNEIKNIWVNITGRFIFEREAHWRINQEVLHQRQKSNKARLLFDKIIVHHTSKHPHPQNINWVQLNWLYLSYCDKLAIAFH